MAKGSSDPNRTLRVEHYEGWFVKLLEECARHRFGRDPDPFLLHARRALEAAVYGVAERAGAKTSAVSLEDLLKELAGRGELPRERMHDFQAMRTRTNRAAHVPPRGAGEPDVDRVAEALLDVIAWIEGVGLCHAPALRERIERARQGIRGTTRAEAPDVELDRLRRASRRPPPGDPAVARPAGGRQRTAFVLGLVGAVALGWFGRGVVMRWTLAGASEHAEPPQGAAPGESQTPGRLERVASATESPLPHEVVSEVVSHSAADVPLIPPSGADEGVASEPRQDVGATLRCPDDMIFVAGGELTLGPPQDRPTWPVRMGRTRTVRVDGFCIARGPVSQQDVDQCARDGACTPRAGARRGPPSAPASFVSQGLARTVCQHRFGEHAGLPTAAQLEQLARSDRGSILREAIRGGPFEWTNDACAAAFEPSRRWDGVLTSQGRLGARMPEPHPRLSWHCRPSPDGTAQDQARCVAPPIDG